jgi:hypothetical protein
VKALEDELCRRENLVVKGVRRDAAARGLPCRLRDALSHVPSGTPCPSQRRACVCVQARVRGRRVHCTTARVRV